MSGYRAISTALGAWPRRFEHFIRHLDREGVSYLSYSKLATVESCEYRYYLQYVRRVKVKEPHYFRKGRAFHEVASLAYRQLAKGKSDLDRLQRIVRKRLGAEDAVHLDNATRLLMMNAHNGFTLIGTEMPFVLSLGSSVPPLIGVIDLLLRKGDTYLVVDHKTGKSLYDQDALQLQLYREHVRRTYKSKRSLACFDEYRWVSNLDRIRAPAFRRTPVRAASWASVLGRVHSAWTTIQGIERTGPAMSGGNCESCLVKDKCPHVSYDWHSW